MEKICKNCKHIIPHVHEYIDDGWKYNAKCPKGKDKNGKLFTIPDRDTYTCDSFKESLINVEENNAKYNII